MKPFNFKGNLVRDLRPLFNREHHGTGKIDLDLKDLDLTRYPLINEIFLVIQNLLPWRLHQVLIEREGPRNPVLKDDMHARGLTTRDAGDRAKL